MRLPLQQRGKGEVGGDQFLAISCNKGGIQVLRSLAISHRQLAMEVPFDLVENPMRMRM